jgi:hypothetical protein
MCILLTSSCMQYRHLHRSHVLIQQAWKTSFLAFWHHGSTSLQHFLTNREVIVPLSFTSCNLSLKDQNDCMQMIFRGGLPITADHPSCSGVPVRKIQSSSSSKTSTCIKVSKNGKTLQCQWPFNMLRNMVDAIVVDDLVLYTWSFETSFHKVKRCKIAKTTSSSRSNLLFWTSAGLVALHWPSVKQQVNGNIFRDITTSWIVFLFTSSSQTVPNWELCDEIMLCFGRQAT